MLPGPGEVLAAPLPEILRLFAPGASLSMGDSVPEKLNYRKLVTLNAS